MMNFRYWARQGTISNRSPETDSGARARTAQGGQALVLFALFFTVILGAAALVLDQGVLRKANYDLYNALDAGALAGVALLKDDAVAAEKVAREYVQLNYPGGLPQSDVNVSFRCLIGAENGAARTTDVPIVCDPGPSATWTIDGDTAYASCNPYAGHVCNTVVVSGPATVDYNFAPVLGVFEGSTGARSAAACKGACGEPPEIPVDLVMILDRTGSMNGVDTANARAAADSVRKEYDPRLQWIGLGLLHRSKTVNGCVSKANNDNPWTAIAPQDVPDWVPIGLTGVGSVGAQDYTADDSPMAKAIACFDNSSGQGTDLADPVRMATYELETHGRPEAVKAILLLSDGKPNNSATSSVKSSKNYCADAHEAAKAAKAKGIEVYTVGFGLNIQQDHICQDTYGDWKGKTAPDLLAAMATASANDHGCPGTENDDGDNYFCLPKTSGASTDLSDVFKKAVQQLSGHSRLVNVD
jgi:ElaB/YqjD/DUF883 family membrane-anchored ribosome-binding protein